MHCCRLCCGDSKELVRDRTDNGTEYPGIEGNLVAAKVVIYPTSEDLAYHAEWHHYALNGSEVSPSEEIVSQRCPQGYIHSKGEADVLSKEVAEWFD